MGKYKNEVFLFSAMGLRDTTSYLQTKVDTSHSHH